MKTTLTRDDAELTVNVEGTVVHRVSASREEPAEGGYFEDLVVTDSTGTVVELTALEEKELGAALYERLYD